MNFVASIGAHVETRRYCSLSFLCAFRPRVSCESMSPVSMLYTVEGDRHSSDAQGHVALVTCVQGIFLAAYVLHSDVAERFAE